MKKVNISQSLIKRIWDYVYGEGCGLELKEVDILKKYQRESSDAMKLGQYFEYLSTGQPLRDGSIPEAPVTSRGTLTTDAKRAQKQAENFNKMLAHKGIEIIDTGTVIQHDNLKIVLDAVVKTPEYEEAIMDLKFTGLLGDKWHEMGWTEETYDYRHGLKIQPLFYKYVYWKAKGVYDVPFLYGIFSSKNENIYDVWEVNLVNFEELMSRVEEQVRIAEGWVSEAMKESGALVPRPDMVRCAKCPMFEDCMFREEVPTTKSVTIFSVRDENREVQQAGN